MSMNKNNNLRMTTTWTLCLCLMVTTFGFTLHTSEAKADPTPGEVDDISQGASQFDEATRDIQGILNLDLNTERGVREAASILKRNERKLAQAERKALHAAMKVTSFQKGLKDEAAKRKGGAEELARELEANHDLVGTIAGAQEAAEAVKASTKPAAETLRRVSEALQKAADAARAKNKPANLHHADLRSPAEPAVDNFCGSYQYICDLLSRLGLYYLRRTLSEIQLTQRKTNCVVKAYAAYGTCAATHWWDLAACSSRLSADIGHCIIFG